MAHVVLIEPHASLRDLVRTHLGAMGEHVEVVATPGEAQARVRIAEGLLVIARGRGDPRYVAQLACAFDTCAPRDPVRLIVLETGDADLPGGDSPPAYLHEVGRTLACADHSAPTPVDGVDPALGLAADFPHDTYRPISRVGNLACAQVYLVRNRVSGLKELLVQTADDQLTAGRVAEALYRNFRQRARPWLDMLRHEVACHHSFISSSSLPFDLARQAGLAAA